jgi:manganese oxidase
MSATSKRNVEPKGTNMKSTILNLRTGSLVGTLLLAALPGWGGWINQTTADPLGYHAADGITGPAFTLTAMAGHITTPDAAGDSVNGTANVASGNIYVWSYGNGTYGAGGTNFQYTAPTLIVNQGDNVTVSLYNTLPFPVSIVFPGQQVSASGGSAGLLTQEVPPGSTAAPSGPVTYTFTATNPGTYVYNSGTLQNLQIEMGMVGALIVRPTGFNAANPTTWKAYNTADTAFDHEFLFVLSDMDPTIHIAVEHQMLANTAASFFPNVDTTQRRANYWFINGRAGPDDMMIAGSKALPFQPYDAYPTMHPGQKLLMRMVGAGPDAHPFHHHANHALNIARNGRLLQSSAAATTADLAYLTYTIPTWPGETTDAIFTFTGGLLGWDMYGHQPSDPMAPFEDARDHGKPFPVVLPFEADMEFGQWYGGSPFLDQRATLPPNLGGFDPSGGFIYMWHSHNEREIVNYNVFMGGMFTMLLVQPWGQ